MIKNTQRLKCWLDQAVYPVAFTGAGVSTDSGLNDFRSANSGLYNLTNPYGVPTEEILTPHFYNEHPQEFFDFYRTHLLDLSANPNSVHYALADMERRGKLKLVITQNADNLHQRAGSNRVIDIHGNVYVNTCPLCGKTFPPSLVADTPGVPHCDCGGVIRPDILLFGEIPDMRKIMAAVKELRRADLLIAAGSSLKVSSAPRMLNAFKGRLVILNRDPTPFDQRADLVINDGLREIFELLWPVG